MTSWQGKLRPSRLLSNFSPQCNVLFRIPVQLTYHIQGTFNSIPNGQQPGRFSDVIKVPSRWEGFCSGVELWWHRPCGLFRSGDIPRHSAGSGSGSAMKGTWAKRGQDRLYAVCGPQVYGGRGEWFVLLNDPPCMGQKSRLGNSESHPESAIKFYIRLQKKAHNIVPHITSHAGQISGFSIFLNKKEKHDFKWKANHVSREGALPPSGQLQLMLNYRN